MKNLSKLFVILLSLLIAETCFALTPTPYPTEAAVPYQSLQMRAVAVATAIPSTYSATPVVPNTGAMVQCRFRNRTDKTVTVSYNGTDDDVPEIAPGATEYDDIAANNVLQAGSIYIKYGTDGLPTTGSFYINCKRR